MIYDGDVPLTAEDDAYAQTIWDAHPAGILAYGVNASGTATDTVGAEHEVLFTRPTLRAVKIRVTLDVLGSYAGDAAVKEYIRETFLEVRPRIGSTGVRSLKLAAFADVIDRGALGGVTGVADVLSVELGFVGGGYASVNLVFAARDMPTLDTADVEVVT
jgi:hypothetical protein